MSENDITDVEPDFPAKVLLTRSIEDKMRSAYLDYAMSVIVSRALPDVRDGVKPVHRRILFAMRQAGNDHNKPFKKSARIVGDVLGKFHPHSQDAVYDSIVRMAQDFSLRYPLIDGQGNFGSVDGDDAAAMRYTEIRMTKLAHAMMADIEKETVDMMPNYDGSEQEPTVLSPTFPSLLVNGSSGIAVGMATNIPPHNLKETIDGCLLLLKNRDATFKQITKKIQAPDFPTAGLIHGIRGVHEAYETGNGRVIMRARAEIDSLPKSKKQAIIVTELPYTVNKALLVEHIASLVREKKLDGISDLRDESDRDGMRVVIELKRDAQEHVLLNNLYKMTEMQKNFSVNMVALVDGVPRILNLKQMILHFLDHRREVIYRRSLFDLERAREKAHSLEGLAVAISNLEEVIEVIKTSPSPVEAKLTLITTLWGCKEVLKLQAKLADPDLAKPTREIGVWGLVKDPGGKKSKTPKYRLSDRQAQSILDMRLARLTALERNKINRDYQETIDRIADLLDILDRPDRVTEIIGEELREIKKEFGDDRRTEIDEIGGDIDNEDLIERQEMVVTLSHLGYIKAQQLNDYREQNRGGKGISATKLRDGDFVADIFHANSHDNMLFFTSRGRVYWKKVYQLPYASRAARGKPVVNLLPLVENEQIQAVLSVSDLTVEDRYVIFATRNGIVKKTPLSAFANPRASGIIAINISDGDRLINCELATDKSSLMLFTDDGKAVRFNSERLRQIGRTARGVIGIRISKDQEVVSMVVADDDEQSILTVTEKGKGKRTFLKNYPSKSRATKGVVNISRSKDTGKIIKCIKVKPNSNVMLITDQGRVIRIGIKKVRTTARSTQGVKLFDLKDERLTGVCELPEDNGNGVKQTNLPLADGEASNGQAPASDEES